MQVNLKSKVRFVNLPKNITQMFPKSQMQLRSLKRHKKHTLG